MDYEYNKLEERMKSLPKDLQLALVSTDNIAIINNIGDKNGLLIDQIGTLIEITSLTLLGLIPSKNFVSELSKQTGVNEKKALDIAKEINEKLFNSIRTSLQKLQPQEEFIDGEEGVKVKKHNDDYRKPEINPIIEKFGPRKPLVGAPSMITPTTPLTVISQKPSPEDISSQYTKIDTGPIEKAGDFVVDIEPRKLEINREEKIDRDSILKGIEDPDSSVQEGSTEVSMIDHLLTAPVTSTQTVESKKVVEESVIPTTPKPVINKPYSADPYREQI